MKINNKNSPLHEENRKAMKDNKTNSRSPNEADLNKGRSLKTEALWDLTINVKHTFSGGAQDF